MGVWSTGAGCQESPWLPLARPRRGGPPYPPRDRHRRDGDVRRARLRGVVVARGRPGGGRRPTDGRRGVRIEACPAAPGTRRGVGGRRRAVPVAQRAWFAPVWQAATRSPCWRPTPRFARSSVRRAGRHVRGRSAGGRPVAGDRRAVADLTRNRLAGAAMIVDRILETGHSPRPGSTDRDRCDMAAQRPAPPPRPGRAGVDGKRGPSERRLSSQLLRNSRTRTGFEHGRADDPQARRTVPGACDRREQGLAQSLGANRACDVEVLELRARSA